MKKQVFSVTLCCLLLFTWSVQGFSIAPSTKTLAGTNTDVTPLMDYIMQADANLYIDSSGVATVKISVYGYQGTTTRIEISANLQQYKNGGWVTIKTFASTSNSSRASLSETYRVSKGYSYRVQATVKAYSGSISETQVITSNQVAY